MTGDTRLTVPLKKVKNIRQYVFSGRTALNPVIGCEKGAAIARRAWTEKRPVIDVAEEMTSLSRAELELLLDPVALTDNSK